MDCLFCKIAEKKIPASIILENEHVIVFDDIYPQAPIHKIVIPREHISTLNDLNDSHVELIGTMVKTAKDLAATLKIAESGYRLLFNCNRGGGQTVFHIHLHLIGGRQMSWPPG